MILHDQPSAHSRRLVAKAIRLRDKEHCKYVATQACVICGRAPSEAHHIRFAQPRALSRKVSDEYTVPVCRLHHRELHRYGDETSWWAGVGVDPLPIALELWRRSRSSRWLIGGPGCVVIILDSSRPPLVTGDGVRNCALRWFGADAEKRRGEAW